jgi:hypothetical protein
MKNRITLLRLTGLLHQTLGALSSCVVRLGQDRVLKAAKFILSRRRGKARRKFMRLMSQLGPHFGVSHARP